MPISKEINSTFGVNAREIFESKNHWKVILVDSEEDVLNASPNYENLKANRYGALIAITAKSKDPNYDFVVRVFCDPDTQSFMRIR